MTAPPKPWEGASAYNREIFGMNQFSGSLGADPQIHPAVNFPSSAPPALPPRPLAQRSSFGVASSPYASYGGYGSFGGGYGGGMPGSFGGYGNCGGYGGFGSQGYGNFYGGGFNRMHGTFGDEESRFIQMAEESSRPTFQSIESIVGAVGSVAMMLENTFYAMTSSFRAILGVAENFGRLRSLFAQFWSAFAVFRSLNWLLKKLMVMLGIRTEDEFQAWAEAAAHTQTENGDSTTTTRASSWPAVLFLAVIGAVPYIIVKMLNRITSTIQENTNDPTTWQNPMQALAQYDFQASSPREVSFRAHQIITIAPQSVQGDLWNSGWLLATVDQKTVGLVPVNYCKIIRNPAPAPALPPPPVVAETEPITGEKPKISEQL